MRDQAVQMVVRLMSMLSNQQLDQVLAQFNETRFTEELVRQPLDTEKKEAA